MQKKGKKKGNLWEENGQRIIKILLTKEKFGLKVYIFRPYKNKRIAVTILFKFNAMAARRHSSVTARMLRFLILERPCPRFSEYREGAFRPYFTQAHHISGKYRC